MRSNAGVLLLLLLGSVAHATELQLQADQISYADQGRRVEARGNVQAQYGDVTIEAESVSFEAESQQIQAVGNVTLRLPPYQIQGRRVHYDFANRRGEAWEVKTDFKRTHLTGSSMRLDERHFDFSGASYSSCPGSPPMFRLTSRSLDLDLEEGILTSQWGFFWIMGVPVFPLPAYVQTLGALRDARRRVSRSPLPQLASNVEDGVYGFWVFPYRTGNLGSGGMQLGYAQRKRGVAEITHTLNFPYNFRLTGRLGGSEVDRVWGGADLETSWTRDKKSEGVAPPRTLFAWEKSDAQEKLAWAKLSYSRRERINFERVSLRPWGGVEAERFFGLGGASVRVGLQTSYGRIQEESTGEDRTRGRAIANIGLERAIPWGSLLMNLEYDWRRYSGGLLWDQGVASLGYRFPNWGVMRSRVQYTNFIHQQGSSPFRFERYRFFGFDFVGAVTEFRMDPWLVELEAQYNVPNATPKERNIKLGYTTDCIEFSVRWMADQGVGEFGLNLVTD